MSIVRDRLLRAFFGHRPATKMPYVAVVKSFDAGIATLSNGLKVPVKESLPEGTKVLVVATEGNPVGVVQ